MQDLAATPLFRLPRPARVVKALLLASAVAMAGVVVPGTAPRAQQEADMVLRIAAVVNDDVISVYDIEARTEILIASAGLPDTAETRTRIRDQVLRALIDETLKLQEGERLGQSVTDEDMASAIAQIEQQNGIPPGGFEDFIQVTGVDRGSALRQIRAEVSWVKAVQILFRDRVDISEEQVDLVMERLEAARGKPEHLVSEIFLPVDNPADDGRVLENAQRLLAQLRNGASFAPLARQFSHSPSAANGGRLGWVRQGELDKTLEDALLAMEPNTISNPIRTVSGYHILALADRRRTAEPQPERARLTVSQLALPSRGPKAMSQATRDEIKTVVANTVKTCADLNRLAKEMNVPNSGPVGTVPVQRLEGPMRDVLMNLDENQVSEPLQTPGGELILMVCDRQVPGGMPTRDEIRERLTNERIEALANRRLRTLRQQALIDVRI
ncbi:peptidylprolyl isomerase [Roseospira marina]|uniref:Parvulin-like PPIase n=1 Tax=Roseospira marina TaxID=140057 RepID=A0A5M6IHS0_9PROT|nr:peptidylprolyl isomerase [Roseospira marina]KAA5607349.1 peptidylprolyl isomerase [Roseospira marina]MBB4312485.1 peptidyl-prolyl cis-trans isomerase SurA [Roseospira marina]MBB5085499.1 peptidyl-prolyl cis-trans isomerase SurA [Roseospira marina]